MDDNTTEGMARVDEGEKYQLLVDKRRATETAKHNRFVTGGL